MVGIDMWNIWIDSKYYWSGNCNSNYNYMVDKLRTSQFKTQGEIMGTRSTVTIYDEDNKQLLHLFGMFDGYLSGVGRDICNYLNGKVLTNGFREEQNKDVTFNGMSDLGLRLAFHLKGGDKIGGWYAEAGNETEFHHYDIRCGNSEIIISYICDNIIIIDNFKADAFLLAIEKVKETA